MTSKIVLTANRGLGRCIDFENFDAAPPPPPPIIYNPTGYNGHTKLIKEANQNFLISNQPIS